MRISDWSSDVCSSDLDTGGKLNIAQICMMQDKGWIHLLVRSKPMVGAVHGAAIGLGVTQLLPMDIRIGGEGSTWSFPFLSLGYMPERSEEHTSELQSLMRISYAVFCLKIKTSDNHMY